MSRQKKLRRQESARWAALKRFEKPTLLGLIILAFIHAKHFEFIQDDSFITFRYINNFIEGHGLVFNIGERVEGYTTFLWTVLLALPAKLGFDLITISQLAGVACILVTLYLMYTLSREIADGERPAGFSLIAVLFMVANGSLAYWSISGMETALFTLLTILGVVLYLRERKQAKVFALTPAVFVLLSFTRPEGMLLFALTMAYHLFDVLRQRANIPWRFEIKRMLVWSAIYVLPIAIFTAWRLSYYGYFFPNTFYAKAGVSQVYLSAGIDYFWAFSKSYMFWGLLFVAPIYVLIRRKWPTELVYFFVVIVGYSAYILSVGGDVLAAYRFFIPILPLIYLFVQEALLQVYRDFSERRSTLRHLGWIAPLVLAYYTYSIPYDYVRRYWELENGLVSKMTAIGEWIKARSTENTVIAASTIGAVSYYSDVTLVDMLGLTDETIAHHPETIFGVKSGWRERNYNVTYVLSRKPDWILFSTEIKPSAFAERALFTREEFRRWYYPYYFHPAGDANEIRVIYKRSDVPRDSLAVAEKTVDNEFINQYYEGVNRSRYDANVGLQYFRRSVAMGPLDFALVYQDIADLYWGQKNTSEAINYYQRALEIDPRLVMSHMMLGYIARTQRNDSETARYHFERMVEIDPDYSLGWTLLGEVYLALGNPSEAQAAFERSLQAAPINNKDAANYLQRLASRG